MLVRFASAIVGWLLGFEDVCPRKALNGRFLWYLNCHSVQIWLLPPSIPGLFTCSAETPGDRGVLSS